VNGLLRFASKSSSILAKNMNPALDSPHALVLQLGSDLPHSPQIFRSSVWNPALRPVIPMSGQPATALTDEELARRFQLTGDAEYFAQIFARHRRRVFLACRRFFACNGLAEDATQEAFLRAYQAIGKFQEGNLCGWLMRIAKNVCIDVWRNQRPESQLPDSGSINPPETVGLDHRMEFLRALQRVKEEMKTLTPEQRRCLEMKMEGYSYEETAERTGLSRNAVKSHLQNGRRMLWSRVQDIVSQLP